MDPYRRNLLKASLAVPASFCLPVVFTAAAAGVQTAAHARVVGSGISVCEPFITSELTKLYRSGDCSLVEDPRAHAWAGRCLGSGRFAALLQDTTAERIARMDAATIRLQVLTLPAPGVQLFTADRAAALARSSNEQLAEICAGRPERFAGLATLAGPAAHAAQELEYACSLGLKGGVIHPGLQADATPLLPDSGILEAAAALAVPLYIDPFLTHGITEGSAYVTTVRLQLLAIIHSGALDRYPGLRLVAGAAGEDLGEWIHRLDTIQDHGVLTGMEQWRRGTKPARRITDYLREQVYFTSRGMRGMESVRRAGAAVGAERLLFGSVYPEAAPFAPLPGQLQDEISSRQFFRDNAMQVFSIRESTRIRGRIFV